MKPKILYVDDEPQNLFSFKATFREFFTIKTCNSAADGLDYLRNTPPNDIQIIISDQRMPAMLGDEFFTQIPEDHKYATRILLTAYADLEATKRALNNGKINFFLDKPFSEDQLMEVLSKSQSLFNDKIKGEIENRLEQIISKRRMRKLIDTHEESKELLSEELHENIAQELSGLKFFLHSLEINRDSPDFPDLIKKINGTLDQSIENIRDICFNVMPRSIKNYGFEGGISELIRKFNATSSSINITFVKDKLPTLSAEADFFIYSIFENIMRSFSSHSDEVIPITIEVKGNLNISFQGIDKLSNWELGETLISKIEAYSGKVTTHEDRLEIHFNKLKASNNQ